MLLARPYRSLVLWTLMAIPAIGQGQPYSCTTHLPYVQDFDNLSYQTPHAGSAVDMTLVTEDNCWTQYIYRSIYTNCSMIAPNHTGSSNHALWMFAHHPMAGQPDRVAYTYTVSPAFHELPTVISFDVQYKWYDPTGDNGTPDGFPWHAGVLQLGYVTDESDPTGNYFPIENIVIDTAAWFSGNTQDIDCWHHYRLDLRTRYSSLPTIRRLAFKPNCNMDSLAFVDIWIDNLRVADEMDTVDYRDTVCPGQPYSGYGFTVDSTETATAGLHVFSCERMENHGMAHYRLALFVPETATTDLYQSIDLGDTLSFGDTLLATSGNYPFRYPDVRGCDSVVTLHLSVVSLPEPVPMSGGIWFPNAFTPDAETNNRFGAQTSLPVEEFEMTIYTRTGLLVWESNGISVHWDGTHNGTPLPQAVYVYHWQLKSNGLVRTGIGTVLLLR